MNSISFQGSMTITTWNKAISSSKKYPTSEAQDKKIKSIAKSIGKKGEVNSLNKKQANFIHQLIERFIKKEIPNNNTEKLFYNDGNQIVFSDKNPALFDGMRVEMDFT